MITKRSMEFKVVFYSEKAISKDFMKIPKKYQEAIFSKLEKLSKAWIDNSQVKKLNNYELCDYRLRVGDYRILFNLDDEKNEVIIFRILHRSKLY